MRRISFALTVTMLATVLCIGVARSQARLDALPVRTPLKFHFDRRISSAQSKAGDCFGFVLMDDLRVGKTLVAASGTTGAGTIEIAGHAGPYGHEGDLMLRLDSIPTHDGRWVVFTDERLNVEGRNRKLLSGLARIVPNVGTAGIFVHGSDIVFEEKDDFETAIHLVEPIADVEPRTCLPAPSAPPVVR